MNEDLEKLTKEDLFEVLKQEKNANKDLSEKVRSAEERTAKLVFYYLNHRLDKRRRSRGRVHCQ